MTRMTGPDCAVMCNLINTHTHARMTGPDCVVMCNLINTHTHTHTHAIYCIYTCIQKTSVARPILPGMARSSQIDVGLHSAFYVRCGDTRRWQSCKLLVRPAATENNPSPQSTTYENRISDVIICMYVCMVTHVARVWMNRVWLPILFVVS